MVRPLEDYDKRIRDLIEMLGMMAYRGQGTPLKPTEEFVEYLNCGLHLLQANLDITICMKHMDVSDYNSNDAETNYFARVLALHCHGLFEDVNILSGQPLKKYREDIQYSAIMQSIGSKTKEIKLLRRNANDALKLEEVRNKVIAHRDGSGLEQAKRAVLIDIGGMYELGEQLTILCMQLFGLLMELNKLIPDKQTYNAEALAND